MRRWIWGVVLSLSALIAAWGALAHWVLPDLLRERLIETVAAKTQHTTHLGGVEIRPFKLAVTLRDFSLHDDAGRMVAGFSRLHVDVSARSFLRMAPTFSEISLVRPEIQAIIEPDGALNLARLVPPGDPGSPMPLRTRSRRVSSSKDLRSRPDASLSWMPGARTDFTRRSIRSASPGVTFPPFGMNGARTSSAP